MARRSPPEKKALSYEKDRRNSYGESDHGSRESIPRNKRAFEHANRRAASTDLAAAAGQVDLDRAERVEARLRGRRPKRWIKVPDTPLERW